MSGHEQVVVWQVLPTGCDPDDVNARAFAVRVEWRGTFSGRSGGGWAVLNGGSELSRAGKWGWMPQRFQRWQYRFEDLTEAQDRARAVVDDVVVNGRTFAQWQARRAESTEGR